MEKKKRVNPVESDYGLQFASKKQLSPNQTQTAST